MVFSGGPHINSIRVQPVMEKNVLETSDNNQINNNEEIDPFNHTIEISFLQWIKVK